MAGVALVAAVDAVLSLNGSFGHRRGTAPDPLLTFALSSVERQVTKYSSLSKRLLNDKSSDSGDPLQSWRKAPHDLANIKL